MLRLTIQLLRPQNQSNQHQSTNSLGWTFETWRKSDSFLILHQKYEKKLTCGLLSYAVILVGPLPVQHSPIPGISSLTHLNCRAAFSSWPPCKRVKRWRSFVALGIILWHILSLKMSENPEASFLVRTYIYIYINISSIAGENECVRVFFFKGCGKGHQPPNHRLWLFCPFSEDLTLFHLIHLWVAVALLISLVAICIESWLGPGLYLIQICKIV